MLKLALLGRPIVNLPGSESAATLGDLGTSKVQALLYYLVVTGRPHTRQALADLLWGDEGQEKARRSLRTALAMLTKQLPDYIHSSHETIAFRQDRPFWLDVTEYAAPTASTPTASTPPTSAPQIAELEAACRLYRGEFLEQFQVADAPAFEEWLVAEQAHWQNQHLMRLNTLTQHYLQTRRYEDAIHTAEQILAIEPWDEAAHRLLMTAYSRLGDFNQALVHYDRCRAVLAAEVDVPPMPETEALAERIQSARQARPHNLPAETTPFVGRNREQAYIADLLGDPDTRLITLVGLGGVGKSRLALEAAAQANREQAIQFLNGVVWVPLVGVTKADTVPATIANALGTALTGRSDPQQELLDYLRNKEVLLVLDNLEHLPDVAALLQAILKAAPDVKLLVTSRRPLGLKAERRLDIEGLSYPEKGEDPTDTPTEAWEAVELFVKMAQQVQPGFAITPASLAQTHTLCRLVGGIPLAIKLAAVWLRLMPIDRIVDELMRNLDLLATRLRDLPPRQRSMRVVYDYTWSLLSIEERATLAALSVFRGGWDAAAAIAVADAPHTRLAQLVDRRLLKQTVNDEGVRYSMHELTRQYAAEHLADPGAVRRAHSSYFAGFAQRQYSRIAQGDYPQVCRQLSYEDDNFDAAWQSLVDDLESPQHLSTAVDALAQAATPLAWYYRERARYRYGRQLFGAACTALGRWVEAEEVAVEKRQILVAWVRLHVGLAFFEYSLGNYAAVQATIAPLLPHIPQALVEEEAMALDALARTEFRLGNYTAAEQFATRSGELFRAAGNHFGELQARSVLSTTLADLGDYPAAGALQQAIAEGFRRMNYTAGLARMLTNLANTHERQGQRHKNLPLLEEAHTLAQAENNRFLVMFAKSNLALYHLHSNAIDKAVTLYQESLRLAREMDEKRWITTNLIGLSRAYTALGYLPAAEQAGQEALTLAVKIKGRPDILSSVATLGQIWAKQGRLDKALRALITVERDPAGAQWDRDLVAPLLAELRSELPATVLAEAEAWCTVQTLERWSGEALER